MRSRRRASARVVPLLGASLVTLLVAAEACTTEHVTGVTVQAISVMPPSLIVLRDDSVQLVAEVLDEEGRLLDAGKVTWSSNRPEVVSVSADGVVRAIGVGPATVTASLGGAIGSASVIAMARALLRAEPESATLRGAVGAGPPEPFEIHILDDGQEVEGLSASVAFPAGSPEGWLEARLQDDESPTELEVRAQRLSSMPAGAYTASVLVSGRDTRETPIVIPVTLTLAGISVQETGGRTLVEGSSGSDEIRVALMLRPEADVVVRVGSKNANVAEVAPGELRFTASDWSAPQTLTVTAGSGGSTWWGFESTEVTLEVDRSRSDVAYAPVQVIVVPVTVYRSPFR